jgi:hypothetical protein
MRRNRRRWRRRYRDHAFLESPTQTSGLDPSLCVCHLPFC